MAPFLVLSYEIKDVTPAEDKIIKKCLTGYTKPFVKCGKEGYVMPGAFRKHALEIYNMEVRADDIWVVTYPRSGTTWTQEIVWLLENNLNFEAAKEKPLYERFPMLEITSQIPELAFELIKKNFLHLSSFQGLNSACSEPSWKTIAKAPSPRFIKTHLPFSMLPPDLLKAKVIYVARDPRDVAVSYYYLHKMISKPIMRASFNDFWEAFRKDLLPWSPIVPHANEAWQQRNHPNVYYLVYEDMKKDLPLQINKLCQFLGRSYGENDLLNLVNHVSFNNLKKNKNVNNTTRGNDDFQFIRKGEAGGWRAHFDEKMEVQAEEFLIKRLQSVNLSYPSFPLTEVTHL